MAKLQHPKLLLITLLLGISFGARAQLPDNWSVVPLDAGEEGEVEPNANNIIFFSHRTVPDSAGNFYESPSHLLYNGDRELDVSDLAGAPGFAPVVRITGDRESIEAMLADPAGLCYENFLLSLTCTPAELTLGLDKLSWQQLVADLRNTFPEEPQVPGLAQEVQGLTLSGRLDIEPYKSFSLGSVIGNLSVFGMDRESPPAICYDIVQYADWIACPVFGKIYVRQHIPRENEKVIELQSPIIIYRLEDADNRYHLAGYLANPFPYQYDIFDATNDDPRRRSAQQAFPVALATGKFSGFGDIAVMSTATLPHIICHQFNEAMAGEGLERLPWELKCTYGVLWKRAELEWSFPRETFEAAQILIAAPKIYSMATGSEAGKDVLFAPSNAPTPDGKFYVLKYYQSGLFPIEWGEYSEKLVPPKLIEVNPPDVEGKVFGPFKVASLHVNADLYADFALTWKEVEDERVSAAHHTWKGSYSPYVSLFLSQRVDGETVYRQFDFQVPRPNSVEIDSEAQLAAIAFGYYQGQKYLVVGNNKRIQVDGGSYDAFAYFFPISDGIIGIIDSNVKTVKVSFKEGSAGTPGVGDLTTDPRSGIIASALRNPFIPAPESCQLGNEGVYGYRWLGKRKIASARTDSISPITEYDITEYDLLDFDHDGIPNRCECGAPEFEADGSDDTDWDELADDVPECDTCLGFVNLDMEVDREGDVVGDGVADACDNCPPSRCSGFDTQGFSCRNEDQDDSDGDGMGDACDACPDSTNLTNGGVYAWGDECIEFCGTGIDCCTPNLCNFCAFGYLMRDGRSRWYVNDPQNFQNDCDVAIVDSTTTILETDVDEDGDGVPNARDNCVYVSNPPPAFAVTIGTSGNLPSGQLDADDDGSGNACDPCGSDDGGLWDDCDNDEVPNRFDREPTNPDVAYNQPPDTVYDPYAGYIADVRDLKLAGAVDLEQLQSGTSVVDNFERFRDLIRKAGPAGKTSPEPAQPTVCGFPENAYPGPVPCDDMGQGPREITVILPTTPSEAPPPQCIPGPDPACTPEWHGDPPFPSSDVSRFCVSKVGRENPRTAALFPEEQARVIEANNRIQAITGIANFDILVGAEGGVVHWECLFAAGAYPSVARATNILPDVAGNVAPFMLAQLSGLPPIYYGRRPDLSVEIRPPQALLLGPISAEEGVVPLLPNMDAVVPRREWRRMPAEGVQIGELRENINGSMVFKVLHAGLDIAHEGTSLAVSDMQSLVVIDYKSYPEPSTEKPIEQRLYNVDYLITQLQSRVEEWKRRGKTITVEIYRDLPWETSMKPEFVIVQATVPEAVASINQALAVDPSIARVLDVGAGQMGEGIPEGYTHQVILPLYIKPGTVGMTGGGCGCHVNSAPISLLAFLIYLFCLLAPVPVFLYYRKRLKK